jgi:hypothetical protein
VPGLLLLGLWCSALIETLTLTLTLQCAAAACLLGLGAHDMAWHGMALKLILTTASAAVYFKTPTGYVDLPGGVTLWSLLTLIIFGVCTVGQLCCLYSQCKAYGYGGGVFDPRAAKSRSVGHLL